MPVPRFETDCHQHLPCQKEKGQPPKEAGLFLSVLSPLDQADLDMISSATLRGTGS